MTSGRKNLRHSQHEVAIRPLIDVYEWGTTLVIASRPDTDIMGCGGAIALLRQMGYRVHVLYICDTFHHQSSCNNLPAKCLKDLRKYEAENALSKLGVSEESITFLDIKDKLVPSKGQDGFDELVGICKYKLNNLFPDTILIPWRFAQINDHMAVRDIVCKARRQEACSANVIEYAPQPWIDDEQLYDVARSELPLLQLDNKAVLESKLEALSQYYEEEINLFQDELPTLTALNGEKLSYMTHPWEIFLKAEDVA
ncbi:PIG-L family deacetylase [Catalinimonas sp. 4WD22]|uniref:PIG-L deacetylase family protein n=1 Tax=Catalinimonas locisalis TaxID=3133978 RepID=UPI0031016D9D